MNFLVFGTGAVGGCFGGRLAQAGEDVTFIARGNHLRAILDSGLRVDSISGDFLIHPAHATDSPESIGAVDVIIHILPLANWIKRKANACRKF